MLTNNPTWRWVDHLGRAMTEWTADPLPPPELRVTHDEKGGMHVQIRENKPILCLDFDGVIHAYTSPWTDACTISDGIVPGFFEWAAAASAHFRLVVYSSRSAVPGAIEAMRAWMYRQRRLYRLSWDIPEDQLDAGPLDVEFVTEKPPAFLTIDDRAVQFGGDWASPELKPHWLTSFKPWNKVEQPKGTRMLEVTIKVRVSTPHSYTPLAERVAEALRRLVALPSFGRGDEYLLQTQLCLESGDIAVIERTHRNVIS